MKNSKLILSKIKDKVKNTNKKTWITIGIIGGFVILAIVLIIVAMHINGYSLGEFIVKFSGWFIMGLLLTIVLILSIVFWKVKKGK